MFKFLKKKFKKFEDELEAELQIELEKETKKTLPEKPVISEQKPKIEEKPVEKKEFIEKPLEKPEKIEKIVAEKPKEQIPKIEEKPVEKKVDALIKKSEKPDKIIRREQREIDRKKREEEIDKQIEKSIETELEHTLRTKQSIEEVVKVDYKPSRGINEEKLDDLLWELEVGLLESDVAYSVIESIKRDIKEEIKHVSFERGK